jgi:hypothetical protein
MLRPTKKKTGPDEGPVQFASVGAPTITFQRGTAACIVVAIWEDEATESPRSTMTMRGARVMHNAMLYMSAMRKGCAVSAEFTRGICVRIVALCVCVKIGSLRVAKL